MTCPCIECMMKFMCGNKSRELKCSLIYEFIVSDPKTNLSSINRHISYGDAVTTQLKIFEEIFNRKIHYYYINKDKGYAVIAWEDKWYSHV